MKLGQKIKVLISKRGRVILDIKGWKCYVFKQLEETVSNLTSKQIEIIHEADCTFNLFVDNEPILWVGDGITTYELNLIEGAIEKLISPKGYKIQLVEAYD